MKTTATKKPVVPVYEPVSLNIAFETQKELNAFAALFNYSYVNDALKAAGCADAHMEITDLLERHGAEIYPAWNRIEEEMKKRHKITA